MQNLNLLIDMIQNSKRQFVYATVTNEIIKEGLLNFVDKQTELCKIITKNAEDFSKINFNNMIGKGNICRP